MDTQKSTCFFCCRVGVLSKQERTPTEKEINKEKTKQVKK